MVGSVCPFLHNPYVNLRLSTSLISLSRCLCLSLSLCSLIWSKDRMSFFSLLDDLRSRLFVLWGTETKYKINSKLGKSIWRSKSHLACRCERQVLFIGVLGGFIGWMLTYSFLAFGFDTDDRLSFGLVHDYGPLISPCQNKYNLIFR